MEEKVAPLVAPSAFIRKLRVVCRLSAIDLLLIAASWWMIAIASMLIALLPSRRLLRTLGPNLGAVTHAPRANALQRKRARQISNAIGIAGRNAPFRSNCYPQALASAQLCRWLAVPHALHLGARFGTGGGTRSSNLEGHAWVCTEQLTICGGSESDRQFGALACFVHIPRTADAVA